MERELEGLIAIVGPTNAGVSLDKLFIPRDVAIVSEIGERLETL